ncbi:MAG: hypothetical protein K2G47_08565 [Muribaculum sp.]|nr:hypothetical protein [Muribaculum sp.]
MKRIYYFLGWCVCFFVISIAIHYAVDESIDKKVDRLHFEAIANLNSFFESKPKYVDLLYGPYGCDYKKIEIPAPEVPRYYDVQSYIEMVDSTLTFDEATNRIQHNLNLLWEKQYGNYREIYDLNIIPPSDDNTQIQHNGWALRVVCKQPEWVEGDGIEIYSIFPKQIAYKKIAPILYGSVPSVESAIQDALDFTIRDEKSDLQPYYERGSTYNLISKMKYIIDNEYYHFVEDSGKFFYSKSGEYGVKRSSIEYGGMHNGYYEVIYHRTQPIPYSIQFVGNDKVQSDKRRLTLLYVGMLACISLGVIVIIMKKR